MRVRIRVRVRVPRGGQGPFSYMSVLMFLTYLSRWKIKVKQTKTECSRV